MDKNQVIAKYTENSQNNSSSGSDSEDHTYCLFREESFHNSRPKEFIIDAETGPM